MRIVVPDHVQIKEIKGQYFLLYCRKNLFYAVGHSGGTFLKLIQSNEDVSMAVKKVSELYHTSYQEIDRGMNSFVDLLIEQGLVIVK